MNLVKVPYKNEILFFFFIIWLLVKHYFYSCSVSGVSYVNNVLPCSILCVYKTLYLV